MDYFTILDTPFDPSNALPDDVLFELCCCCTW